MRKHITLSFRLEADKLKTVKNYAETKEVTVQAIYAQIKKGKIESIRIDGVWFVRIG